MTIVRVNDDGTVSPIVQAKFYDYSAGEAARSGLLNELAGWSSFLNKYSNLMADTVVPRTVVPIAKGVLYLTSVVSFLEVIRHAEVVWHQGWDLKLENSVVTKDDFCFELFRLAQRVNSFVYRFMMLEIWRTFAETALMRITTDITAAVESIWKVVRADKCLKDIENPTLKKLKVKENNFLFVNALVDIAFHTLGFAALLSSAAVSGNTMVIVGLISVASSLATKYVTQERCDEESRIAAVKVNKLVEKAKVAA